MQVELKSKMFPQKKEAEDWAKEQKANNLQFIRWDVTRVVGTTQTMYEARLYGAIR